MGTEWMSVCPEREARCQLAELPCDLNALRSSLGDDDEVLTETLEAFLADYEPTMANLRAAVAGNSHADVAFWAHKLKGTAWLLRARQFGDAALLLEKLALDCHSESLSREHCALESEARRVVDFVRERV